MRKFLTSADVLIGHNIKRWDIPTLERILDIKITAKLVDTLGISWYLYPDRKSHGLDGWGNDLGVKKPEIKDWHNLSQEEYENRCREDVKINTLLWNKMHTYLLDIYGSNAGVWKLLDYITFKLHCAMLQEKSRWKVDIPFVKSSLEELLKIQEEKLEGLKAVMPDVPDIHTKTKPKRFLNKYGDYTKMGMEWVALCHAKGLPSDYDGEIEIVKGYTQANPNSNVQKKNWLFSLGWVPRTFKEKKDEDGNTVEIPQINLEHGKGICESIKVLYDDHPYLELLEGLSVLQHRIGILNGFLRDQNDGYLLAQVAGLTNTLRFKHQTIVNLPKPDKLFAAAIRGALISDEGTELCGSDMSSLEDRIKQHFLFPHDPDYVREMMKADYDPHLSLALSASAVTIAQVQGYMSGEDKKTIKNIRDVFKNGNYACQYGSGVARLAKTAGVDMKTAAMVHKAYWDKNWAIKVVVGEQRVKTIDGQMWLFNPISELWYSLRFEKDIFSTLVQGTASYVFDLWVEHILEKREQLTAQFHDEIVLTVQSGYSHYNEEQRKWEGRVVDFLKNMIAETNKKLKLNRELDIDVQFGRCYSDIH